MILQRFPTTPAAERAEQKGKYNVSISQHIIEQLQQSSTTAAVPGAAGPAEKKPTQFLQMDPTEAGGYTRRELMQRHRELDVRTDFLNKFSQRLEQWAQELKLAEGAMAKARESNAGKVTINAGLLPEEKQRISKVDTLLKDLEARNKLKDWCEGDVCRKERHESVLCYAANRSNPLACKDKVDLFTRCVQKEASSGSK